MIYSQIYLLKFFFQISTSSPTFLNNKVTDINQKRRRNSGTISSEIKQPSVTNKNTTVLLLYDL